MNRFLTGKVWLRLIWLAVFLLMWPMKNCWAVLSASAGSNQTVLYNATVTLSGSASDVTKAVKRWQWRQISGKKVKLRNANRASVTFVSPSIAGTLKFMLTVTDKAKPKAYAVVSVTVVPNAPGLTLVSQNFSANQAIAAGQTQVLTWSVRNDSGYTLCAKDGGISSCKIALVAGNGTGGLTYTTIQPESTDDWANGVTKDFSVSAIAPATIPAGSYQQAWTFSYDSGQSLPVAGNDSGLSAQLSVAPIVSVSLQNAYYGSDSSDTYQAGDSITQGSSKVLNWVAKNNSNTALGNVVLTAGAATGNLQVAAISPASIASWASGESKTFSVTVTAPADDLGGNHALNWNLSYGGGTALTLDNSQQIGFSLQTPNPNIHLVLVRRYFENNAAVVDGSQIAQGGGRSVKWDIRNDSSVVLNNVSLSPGSATGNLTIGAISPAVANTWGIGETKTFSVAVSAGAGVLSGRHGKVWSLALDGNPLNLDGNQTVGFSLTTAPLSCEVSASPSLVGLTKLNTNGVAAIASSASWSCVKDNSSGLIWEVKSDDGGLRDKDNVYTWSEAQAYVQSVNAQGLCGGFDWRLPTAEELLSLVGARTDDASARVTRLIDYDFYPNSQTADYWSNSDSSDGNAWGVSFEDGGYVLNAKTSAHYVRLVRDAN